MPASLLLSSIGVSCLGCAARRKALLLKPMGLCRSLGSWATVGLDCLRYMSETRVCHAVGEVVLLSHDTLGLPWWGAISSLAIGGRLLLFPLSLYIQKQTAFSQGLFLALGSRIKVKTEEERKVKGWTAERANKEFLSRFRIQKAQYEVMYDLHPNLLTVWSLMQIPVFIVMTLALRNLCGGLHFIPGDIAPVISMCTEGALWFPNLLQQDIVLPVVLASLAATSILVSYTAQPTFPSDMRLQRIYQNIRLGTQFGFSIIMVLVAYSSPSAIAYFWSLSTLVGLIQQVCLSHRVTKAKLGIKPLPWDLLFPWSQDSFQQISSQSRGLSSVNYGKKIKTS